MDALLRTTHFFPIVTTLLAVVLARALLLRFASKPEAMHLLWWGIGIITYGAGTLVESLTTLFGWNVVFFKTWYILGALLGGAPLGIGTLYLLWNRSAGSVAVIGLIITVVITGIFVILSPIKWELVDPQILNSRVLEWQKIRLVSPFVNGFAFLFLVGGAIYSAFKYARRPESRHVAFGNAYIAVGGLLPGVGGAFSRFGHTEALYAGELIGVILIWVGYRYCQRRPFQRAMLPSVEAAR